MRDDSVKTKVTLTRGKAVNKGNINLEDNVSNALGMFVNINSDMTNEGTIKVSAIAQKESDKYKFNVAMRADQADLTYEGASAENTEVINKKDIKLTGQGAIGMIANGSSTSGADTKYAIATNKAGATIEINKEGTNISKNNFGMLATNQAEVINKGEKEFKTVLSVEADNISLNSLKDFLSVLANEKIYEVKRNAQGVNIFEIEMRDKSAKAAYQKALDKFNGLQQKLGSKGLRDKIKIVGFTNDEVSLEKRESVKKEINTVTHTIEVETRDMKNIGNIISVAQILGIGTNGYIEYDIDNKQKLEDELYENAYKEALKKAQVILGKTDLNLKNPVTITDKSQGVIRPYSDYNYSYYGNVLTDSKILEKSEKELLDKVSEKRIVVNPRKLDISKTVYIEFEMN